MSRAWPAILAAVVLLPLVVRQAIATEIWIFAIFGLGLNLLLGYTGLLSFGQSTFFGSAAYVAGYLLKLHGINVFAALGIGIVVGAVSAAGCRMRKRWLGGGEFRFRRGQKRGVPNRIFQSIQPHQLQATVDHRHWRSGHFYQRCRPGGTKSY